MLLAILLAVDDECLFRTLDRMQEIHQHDAQHEGHERTVEGNFQLIGRQLEELRSVDVLRAAEAEGAGEAADGADESEGGDRPGDSFAARLRGT